MTTDDHSNTARLSAYDELFGQLHAYVAETDYACEHLQGVAAAPCCGSLRRLMREHGITAEAFGTILGNPEPF